MTRSTMAVTIAGFLSVVGPLSSSATMLDEKSELQALLAENQNLTLQVNKAEKTKGDIAKAELSVSGAQSALTRFKDQLKRNANGLEAEAARINQEDKQSGCPWGTKSTDEAFVKSCNEEGKRIGALILAVKNKAITLQQFGEKLEAGQKSLSDRTELLFKQKKANNADLEDIYASRTDFMRRYHNFVFRSEAYDRLKGMAPVAELCQGLSLEAAQGCLSRLWSGR